jgi:Beta-lactamase
VTGVPLAQVAREHIFKPLGMTATTWSPAEVPAASAVCGYQLEDDSWVAQPALPDGAFGPMGGLCTSIGDFARYVAMHLSAWPPRDDPENLPLRRSTLREMAQAWRSGQDAFDFPGTKSSGYGYGLASAWHERDGHLVAHSGGLPGFGSHVEWLPEHGVGIIAFANLTYARVRVPVRRAFDALAATGGLQPRRVAAPEPLLAAQRWLTGLYEHWDDARARSHAAGNLFLDLPADRRRAAMAALRSGYGPCATITPLVAEGALRGRWRMTCAGGELEASVALAPTPEPKVQTYTMARGDAGSPAS